MEIITRFARNATPKQSTGLYILYQGSNFTDNLCALYSRQRNVLQNVATDQTASESCPSSDEDSEVDVALGIATENQSSVGELIATSHAGPSLSPTVHMLLIDHSDMLVSIFPFF